MRVLGVTGGIGAGKSTVVDAWRPYALDILDADAIYHELLRSDTALLLTLETRFPGVVRGGVLDRKRLSDIVFHDPEALAALNTLTHGAVIAAIRVRLDALAHLPGIAVVDALYLFETGFDALCAWTVAVLAPAEARVARVMARDGLSREDAARRVAAQKPDEYYLSRATFSLRNDGTPEDILCAARALWTELRED